MIGPRYPFPDAHSITLEKIRVQIVREMREADLAGLCEGMTVEEYARYEAGTIVQMFRSYVLGMGTEKVGCEWPATWWQHLKQRWFPRWALRRWPVRLAKREFTVYKKVCPHLGVPARDPHLRFFYTDD